MIGRLSRRRLLQSLAGLSMPAAARAAVSAPPRVVVVGAGIMGASIAYHLARRGARVTVLERHAPGTGATQGAFAMLIATHDDDEKFNALYGAAVADWRRLEKELGSAIRIQWGGTASWAAPGKAAEELQAATRKLQSWGAPIRPLGRDELARLVPGIAADPFGAGNFSPQQGTLDPVQALEALVAAGHRQGVAYRFPCTVTSIESDGRRLATLHTSQGPVSADIVVLAAGAAVPELAGPLGIKTPINVVSGTLAHSKPFPRVLNCVLNGPDGSLKQDPDGRIVTGADYRPGASGTDTSRRYGTALLATAARIVPALKGVELETVSLGYVPIPVDTHPIIGFCAAPANLYIALTMSGITMAPLLGRFAASEIIDGLPIDTLASYRPSRFA